ncbi:MAG: NADH-quinone oxidoreductase subunit NuoE [Actinomyces sp.]|nr:NADH-quinone oxidoreductase subunit NuoE [Actinomyces sp.]
MSYPVETYERLAGEAREIIARYPEGHARSALLPMLHLVQSEDGYVSANGIALCAELLGITRAEVSAVATFYTQYKRHPTGEYLVGVCTNALCAVMGGDEIWEAVSEKVGVGTDETNEAGTITLERLECNAACDYAPVVMVNWEFFDNQTPESACALIDDIEASKPLHPTRGSAVLPTFKETEHVLAGFLDGHEHEGPSAGEASTLGLRIAEERGWSAPADVPAEEGKETEGE